LPSNLPNVVLDARQGNGRINVDDVPLDIESGVFDVGKHVVGGDERILPAGEATNNVADVVLDDEVSWSHSLPPLRGAFFFGFGHLSYPQVGQR